MQENNFINMAMVLIIDQDKFSRTLAKNALHQIGIKNIKEADNTLEAMELINNYNFNVILLEQNISDKSGIEFAKELKNHSNNLINEIPIIMITSDTKEKTVIDAKNAGIDEYLIKPISTLALKKRISNVLITK